MKSHLANSNAARLVLLFIISVTIPTICHAAGVAVFKEQAFHADSSAKPIAYKNLTITNAPFIKLDIGDREITLNKETFVTKIDFPPGLPPNIVSENEIKPFRNFLQELSAFSKRFPKSTPLLEQHIFALNQNIIKFDSGNVRYSGEWITKDSYASILEKTKQEMEAIKKQEIARAEERRVRREKEDAFAASQREKGLEQYGENWLPKEKVIELRKQDLEIAASNKAIGDKTIKQSIYSVLQVTDGGMLIEVHRGTVKQGGVNSDLAFLFGAAAGMAAEGDFYKGDLYWCGTYSYTNLRGYQRTVNAYCLDKNDAFQRVRAALASDTSETPTGKQPTHNSANDRPSVPAPLVGAIGSGSGFFVGDNGYFVTNEHVVNDSKNVSIYYGGKIHKAEIVKVSKVADLALLKIEEAVPGIEIAQQEANLGQEVFAIGFPNPDIQGIEIKVTKGVISSIKGLHDDDTRYQIDTAVQPGNSGGPLCDSKGHLVGVVVSGLDQIAIASRTGSIPQNVNYAIKASEVSALLRSKSVDVQVTKDTGFVAGEMSEIKRASNATALVVVRR